MAGLWSEIRVDQNLKFAPIFRNQVQFGRDIASSIVTEPNRYATKFID